MSFDMFIGLVVLSLCLHSISAGSLNETSAECDDFEECVRLCCIWDIEDGSCENFTTSRQIEAFKGSKLFNVDLQLGRPCEMQLLDGSEWFFDVSYEIRAIASFLTPLHLRMEKFSSTRTIRL